MPTTQEGRLLRLTTPLGDDVLLIKRLRAEEGLSRLFHFTLDVLHDHETEMSDDPLIVDVSRLLGQPMTIAVNQNDGTQRFFNGICARFHQGNRKGRFTVYQAVVVPHVWLLTQNIQSRIFQHIAVPDILRQVFEGFEVDYEIQGTFEPRNYCVQYRESDFDFASRIMEEEGIFYYFEHRDGSHRMVIANTPQSHREHSTKSRLPFRLTLGSGEEWIPSILSWSVDHQLRTGKVTLWDHNFELPTSKLDAEQLSRFDIGGNRNLEYYDFPGEYAQRFDGVDSTGGDQADKLQKVFEDRRRVAEIRQQEIDVAYRTSKGTSDCCALTGGYRFEMTDHPVSENNCQHVLVSVQTEAVQTPTYISDDSVANPYVVNFSSIPFADNAQKAPFRPLRKTPKPVVHGSQTAFVVGPAGEEIFTDKYGRVKVQFHWDRDGRNDAASSCWLRVATNIAGNKWGMVHIPRIGQEVVVDFMDGDPDRPIIVGAVYNPQSMPHYELPKFKTLSYYKSRTSPDDGKGFNEIRFEDKQGKEQVFIHSQKRMDTRVRGSFYETCGGNRQEVIGVRTDNQPGGNLAITVGGNYDLHVKDSMYIGIDGKLNEAVKGEVVEDYQSSLATLVKTKAELNAMEIIMEAKAKISLKVGGNCIVIDPSGITIAGTMVKINSGGFGTETGNPSIDDPLDAESADTGQPGYLDRPRTGGGRRGRNRRQLNSQHYVAPPRPGEAPEMTAIRNTLQHSATGRHALEVYDRYGVNSTFNTGVGGGYTSSTNTMNLDPAWGDFNNSAFVHEMTHTETHFEGEEANVQTQSRSDYVDTRLRDEARGNAAGIQTADELAAAGHPQSSTYDRTSYDTAYNQAVADTLAANPNATQEELDAAGRNAGEQAILDDYRSGRIRPSDIGGVTQPPYPDYYGNEWDRNHPSP